MKTRAELKTAAKNQLRGNWGIAIGALIVYALIVAVSSFISWLIAPPMFIGLLLVYMGIVNKGGADFADLFKGFNILGKAVWLQIITAFFVFLWSLLFVIPGIIKALSYSMAPYILAENPGMTARQALRESKRIMKGNIGRLFVLILSFIGWVILCGLTFGILYLYVAPYYQATLVNFYNDVKGSQPAAA
ncbi:MAG TPA: DUF975 family protein [Clostridia bacterium]|nr:DUF975 family protein [Clostridia bacterium]